MPLVVTPRAPLPVVTENPNPNPPPPLLPKPLMAVVAEPASTHHLSALEEPDVSSPEGLIFESDNATDASPSSTSLLESPILERRPPSWYQMFYIRTDYNGRFHMYPDLGGPFHTLQEAEASISHHLNKLRLPAICEKPSKGPRVEWLVKQALYYADGTPKRGPNSPGFKNPNDPERQLVKALLDQYNDHQNLCKDLAHELKDLVSFQWIYEDHSIYYHFNFTTKTKKADDGNLFFAEVLKKHREDFWVITCCCMIEPNDNGHCYGCRNNGNLKTKHPKNTRAYIGGHVDGVLPFGMDDFSDDDEDEEALEARLRFMFKGC